MPGPVPQLAMSAKPEDDTGAPAARSSVTGTELGGLDAQLWHACAGGMVQLPRVGSKVVYFPQGHGEQAASTPDFPRSLGPLGSVPCRVVSVNFLADAETDEVFSRICLQPEAGSPAHDLMDDAPASPPPAKPAAFSKTLTQSDANNGGGFSVPRYCAETIFPPLDYATDPPVQNVLAKDVHGAVWKFRHIYRYGVSFLCPTLVPFCLCPGKLTALQCDSLSSVSNLGFKYLDVKLRNYLHIEDSLGNWNQLILIQID